MEVATSTAMVADEWTVHQQKTLLRWVNSKLALATDVNMPQVTPTVSVEGLQDLSDGLVLNKLTNQLVWEANRVKEDPNLHYLAPMNNRPNFKIQKIENLNDYITYVHNVLKVPGLTILAENIFNGDVKPVVGLLWNLYHFSHQRRTWTQLKLEMLAWVNHVLKPAKLLVNNFAKEWSIDGGRPHVFLEAIFERFVDLPTLPDPAAAKIDALIAYGDKELSIPPLLDLADFTLKNPDEKCILPYIIELHKYFHPLLKAGKVKAAPATHGAALPQPSPLETLALSPAEADNEDDNDDDDDDEDDDAEFDFHSVNDLVYVILTTHKLRTKYEANAIKFLDKAAAAKQLLVPEFADITSELNQLVLNLETNNSLIGKFDLTLKLTIMPALTQMNHMIEVYKQLVTKTRKALAKDHGDLGLMEASINQYLALIDPSLTYFPQNPSLAYANLFCLILDVYTAEYQLAYYCKQVIDKLQLCKLDNVMETLEAAVTNDKNEKLAILDCLQQFQQLLNLWEGFKVFDRRYNLDELEPQVPEFTIPDVPAPVFTIDPDLYPTFKAAISKAGGHHSLADVVKFLKELKVDPEHIDELVTILPGTVDDVPHDADFTLARLLASLSSSLLDGDEDTLFDDTHPPVDPLSHKVFDVPSLIEKIELGFSI